jgi:GGDEF domain-containing protein
VIAPATSPEGAERLMERLQQALEAIVVPLGRGARAFRMRGSYFAVPDYSEASIHVLEMLERASSALHAPAALADYAPPEMAPAPPAAI